MVVLAATAIRQWRKLDGARLRFARADQCGPAPFAAWPSTPKVSVLVAAWNEADQVDEHVASFASLNYPRKQLVLCAGGPDGTYEIAQRWSGAGVTVIEQMPGEGKQGALRRSLQYADGEIVFLTDADCLYSSDSFNYLIRPIACGDAQVVTGMSEPKDRQRSNSLVRYQWFNDLAWADQLPGTVDGVLGRNCALRRDVLDGVGGFDTEAETGTDYVLSRLLGNAGYQIVAAPDSRVATDYPDSPGSYLRMWRRWNKNLLIQGARFEARAHVRGVLLAALLYVSMLVLPAFTPWLGAKAPAVTAALFGVAVINRVRRNALGASIAGRRLPVRDVLRVPFYTLLDLLAAPLAVRDALTAGSRRKW